MRLLRHPFIFPADFRGLRVQPFHHGGTEDTESVDEAKASIRIFAFI
jgi:hypothetical protein